MNDELFVIWEKRRRCWWGPDCCGYTSNFIEAGVYTEAELKGANTETGVDEIRPLGEQIRSFLLTPRTGQRVIDAMLSQALAERMGSATQAEGGVVRERAGNAWSDWDKADVQHELEGARSLSRKPEES